MQDLAPVRRVDVAVLTYRRPDDLTALYPDLVRELDLSPAPATVLIVDNDPEAGARPIVESFTDPRFRYVHEPTPGIAAARNRAIDEVADADLLVFLDDDERPVEGWLGFLVDTYLRTRPAGVVGPVTSDFTGEPDPWIVEGGFFRRRRLPTGTEVTIAATNNLLLDLGVVRAHGLRFDERLGTIGGEDTLFTRRLTSAQGRLVWCAEAMVHDIVPPNRMTRAWVLGRAFRMGGSASAVEVVLAGSAGRRLVVRARQVVLGLTRLGAGLVRLAAGVVTSSRAAGARNLARGSGLIAGSFGYVREEYRRPTTPPAEPRATAA